ncbi:hypothetical protein V1478_017253, partial [Vespula squamosa]
RSHSSGFIVACDATIQTETIERAMRHVDDEPTLTNPAIRKIVLGTDEAMESSSIGVSKKERRTKTTSMGNCVSLSVNVHLSGQQSSDTTKESSKCEKETEASSHTCALVD